VAQHGLSALSWDFFVRMPKPVGEAGGGMANAIVGTIVLIGLAAAVAVPVGVLSGIHLAEYGRSRFAFAVRFAADVLNGVPSIVVGIFAYGLLVLPFRRFSALAGGFALGVMMIPLVTRTTEELLKMVPSGYRDGALALGASRTRALVTIVLPAALPGVVTGILVAVARIAGETAPLLFTSFGNRFWSTSLLQPIGSLPVQIYTYAISPYEDWHRQAWAGALVLVGLVLALSLLSRAALRRLEKMHRP
jgi:phosphate transport system permease protein